MLNQALQTHTVFLAQWRYVKDGFNEISCETKEMKKRAELSGKKRWNCGNIKMTGRSFRTKTDMEQKRDWQFIFAISGL